MFACKHHRERYIFSCTNNIEPFILTRDNRFMTNVGVNHCSWNPDSQMTFVSIQNLWAYLSPLRRTSTVSESLGKVFIAFRLNELAVDSDSEDLWSFFCLLDGLYSSHSGDNRYPLTGVIVPDKFWSPPSTTFLGGPWVVGCTIYSPGVFSNKIHSIWIW